MESKERKAMEKIRLKKEKGKNESEILFSLPKDLIIDSIIYYSFDLAEKDIDLEKELLNSLIEQLNYTIMEQDIADSSHCDLYGVCAGASCKNYYKCMGN